MELLINKIADQQYKIHLINPRNLAYVVTYEAGKTYITKFNTGYDLLNTVWSIHTKLHNSSFGYIPPWITTQVWDIPYYNHAKRTMLTFEMFKLLN